MQLFLKWVSQIKETCLGGRGMGVQSYKEIYWNSSYFVSDYTCSNAIISNVFQFEITLFFLHVHWFMKTFWNDCVHSLETTKLWLNYCLLCFRKDAGKQSKFQKAEMSYRKKMDEKKSMKEVKMLISEVCF